MGFRSSSSYNFGFKSALVVNDPSEDEGRKTDLIVSVLGGCKAS